MDGLPFLPGNSFHDPTRVKHHRSQTLGYTNGYALKKRPTFGIGGDPINFNQLSEKELDELASYNPSLTYGQARAAAPPPFVPAYVALDKKILRFRAWLRGTVHESATESYLVRQVDIFYYLVDDSMAVVETAVENSGLPHGKLLSRQRMPKNDVGETYSWKDLNLDMDIALYGRVFHIYDCDAFTRDWLESQGILVKPPIECPSDPYMESRKQQEVSKTTKAPSDFDKLRQFLELDRKVLRFYCIWDDRDQMFGEARKFILHYYLVNDTIEVREVHSANDGRDPFPILISRQRIPKNRYDVQPTFPAVILELSNNEIKEYFGPPDFGIGKVVQMYNRRFFIYDCDGFTKAYYWKNFGITDFTPATLDTKGQAIAPSDMPETGDDLQDNTIHSCRTLLMQPPRSDGAPKFGSDSDGVVLRFEAISDSTKAEDKGRRFIISYRLSDDMMTIYEPPVKNSGIIGGKFLQQTRVAKPGSSAERPQFYGLQDFFIGAVIDVFKHRFIITGADALVLSFMEQHPNLFPQQTVDTLRERIGPNPSSAVRRETKKGGPILTQRTGMPGELERLVDQVKGQLKRLAITANSRKDRVFLGVEMNRAGFIDKENLRNLCIRQQLPCDNDIIDSLAGQIGRNPEQISLKELRQFLEVD